MDSEARKTIKDKNEKWEIAIGERFPKNETLIETVSDGSIFHIESFPEIATFEMNKNTYSLLIAKDIDEAGKTLENVPGLISAQIFSINNTDIFPKSGKWAKNISFGFRFLGKTVRLTVDETTGRNRPKTFEEIVDEGDDQNKMLAALRLDVDDLGFIFSRGMAKARLGEIVCLSREMQYFFSAHFDQLAAQSKTKGDENEHDLYLIYSGGDDAFAVGKWDNVIHFTKKLQADFEAFVFENPDVHFSAGIFMGSPHYPVGKFYRDAGDLQDNAKDASNCKNRVNIFNHNMTWESFSSKIELGNIFFDALDKKGADAGKLNTAFVYRILNLVKSSFFEHNFTDKNQQVQKRGSIDFERFARNVAGLRYLFARNGMDAKRADELVGKLETALIGDFLKSFDFGPDEQIKSTRDYLVSLNYALYKKRAKPDNQ